MERRFIEVQSVSYTYKSHDVSIPGHKAVNDISVVIEPGSFVAVLGRNGSGKSTFARLLNAILIPDKGTVLVKGMNTSDSAYTWEIRKSAGMVFQNPDNQIVGTVVEEDVAFGPENLGVKPDEIRERVNKALETVGMLEYSKHAPHLLSGGQKQRIAVAGILAMKPECIIFDESTSMLDPIGRKEIMNVIKKLNKEEKITVIHITHHMNEVKEADRLIIIDKGEIVLDGKPSEVFSNVEKVKKLGLDVPQTTELFYELKKEGIDLPEGVLDIDVAAEELVKLLRNNLSSTN